MMARHREWAYDLSYKSYTADMLLGIGRALELKIDERWIDIVRPAQVDTRSGEEIALSVIQKHGLKAVN